MDSSSSSCSISFVRKTLSDLIANRSDPCSNLDLVRLFLDFEASRNDRVERGDLAVQLAAFASKRLGTNESEDVVRRLLASALNVFNNRLEWSDSLLKDFNIEISRTITYAVIVIRNLLIHETKASPVSKIAFFRLLEDSKPILIWNLMHFFILSAPMESGIDRGDRADLYFSRPYDRFALQNAIGGVFDDLLTFESCVDLRATICAQRLCLKNLRQINIFLPQ